MAAYCSSVLLVSAASIAVAQVATATLAGVVRDQTGGGLPEVAISIRSAATGAVRTATTDSDGRYLVTALGVTRHALRAG